MQKRNVKKYGWVPDLPDHRDHKYVLPKGQKDLLPTSYDLRKTFKLPPCYDQGQLGSCTGNGCGFVWQFALQKENKPAPNPARLLIYYYERLIEKTVNQDSGAQIRDGLRVLNQYGCCDEKLCPYYIKDFKKAPTAAANADAKKHTATKYLSVKQDLTTFKTILASGTPIVFGFTVYDSFESDAVAKTGIVPMPRGNDQVVGGHCVCIIGFNDAKKQFIVRNSWGNGWGDSGCCYFPYDYLLNPDLADDFWAVQVVN